MATGATPTYATRRSSIDPLTFGEMLTELQATITNDFLFKVSIKV
jgi:hypothetical protein